MRKPRLLVLTTQISGLQSIEHHFVMELLQDPLDSEDFDPVAYINQRFPTGNHDFSALGLVFYVL